MLCRSLLVLFVLFLLVIMLSVLRFTDFPFGIFTLFLRLVIYIFLYSATERCYHFLYICLVWLMVLNATFNNISSISLWSVLLVEETGVP